MAVRRLASADVQPKDFAFSAENLAWAKKQIEKYPPGREASAVIPLLWKAQEQHGGWLPEPAIRYVADMQGSAYTRRSWLTPVLGGVAAIGALIFLTAILIVAVSP